MGPFVGVVTTGIYCCPGKCSGRPRAENRVEFGSAAAAEAFGLRACYQCRPYRTQPGWVLDGPELVCHALQAVLDGALDNQLERDLARSVGASARHLRRLFIDHLGATPHQIARSARAHFARRLIDDTDLTFAEIAHTAAFGSVRQFNRFMYETFRATPTELRAKRRRSDRLVADGGLRVRLPFTAPYDLDARLEQLAATAIPGVVAVRDGWYRRTIDVYGDPGVVEIGPGGCDHLEARFHLPHWTGLLHHVQRARRLFGLDPIVNRGERVDDQPDTWDDVEAGVVTIVRDGSSAPLKALEEIVRSAARPVDGLADWNLTHVFPRAAAIADDVLADASLDDGLKRRLRQFARSELRR